MSLRFVADKVRGGHQVEGIHHVANSDVFCTPSFKAGRWPSLRLHQSPNINLLWLQFSMVKIIEKLFEVGLAKKNHALRM